MDGINIRCRKAVGLTKNVWYIFFLEALLFGLITFHHTLIKIHTHTHIFVYYRVMVNQLDHPLIPWDSYSWGTSFLWLWARHSYHLNLLFAQQHPSQILANDFNFSESFILNFQFLSCHWLLNCLLSWRRGEQEHISNRFDFVFSFIADMVSLWYFFYVVLSGSKNIHVRITSLFLTLCHNCSPAVASFLSFYLENKKKRNNI